MLDLLQFLYGAEISPQTVYFCSPNAHTHPVYTHISTDENHMISGIIPLQLIPCLSNQSWLNTDRGTEGGKVQDTR